jgi:gamma-glutamylcyclotransferase (GGCT)/AIG2-like uncharacterized protein YtfP
MNEEMHAKYLFVYGSLMSAFNHEMHHLLKEKCVFISHAKVAGELFDLGDYPGAVISQTAQGFVKGELYQINDASIFTALDVYEGCSLQDPLPHEYIRIIASALIADGTSINAWVYHYNWQLDSGKTPLRDGDYLEYLNEL